MDIARVDAELLAQKVSHPCGIKDCSQTQDPVLRPAADLERRIGIKIDKLEVGHIDFMKDAAFIKLYYTLGKGETATIDTLTKAKKFVEQ